MEETRAARLDGWVTWDAEGRVAQEGIMYHSIFVSYISFCFRLSFQERPIPRAWHPEHAGVSGFFLPLLCCGSGSCCGGFIFLIFVWVYISLAIERAEKRDRN